MGDHMDIKGQDGEFQAYIARPGVKRAPAVVVLHEVFGVNADMRQTCEELAAKGFIALCPDLFWRQERGVDLDTRSESDWKKGVALYTAYDRGLGVKDIADTMKAGAVLEGSSGKVGVMGYCLGGLLTFLTAARQSVDAAVVYHGGDTESYLDEAPSITAPMLMHLGELDEFIPPAAQARIKAALAGKPNVEVHSYPGCYHAFARHNGAHYDAAAAAIANGRTWAFLKAHLSSAST